MDQPNDTPLPGGGIALTLDRPRILRLDFNAFCELRKATGQNPLKGEFWADFDDPLKMRATLWASLLHEDKKITLDEVGNLMAVERIAEIANALAACVSAAMPAKKDEVVPA